MRFFLLFALCAAIALSAVRAGSNETELEPSMEQLEARLFDNRAKMAALDVRMAEARVKSSELKLAHYRDSNTYYSRRQIIIYSVVAACASLCLVGFIYGVIKSRRRKMTLTSKPV